MINDTGKMLDRVILNLSQIRTKWQQAMQHLDGNRLASRSLARLGQIPGKPKYPIRWTSERQRRAFFATKGFGRGIPTRRTGKIVRSWEAEFSSNKYGGVLLLVNMHPAVQYLQGENAQGFHKDTGWVQVDDVTNEAHGEMGDVSILTFYQVGDPFQGV
jgi:hypothetical protein